MYTKKWLNQFQSKLDSYNKGYTYKMDGSKGFVVERQDDKWNDVMLKFYHNQYTNKYPGGSFTRYAIAYLKYIYTKDLLYRKMIDKYIDGKSVDEARKSIWRITFQYLNSIHGLNKVNKPLPYIEDKGGRDKFFKEEADGACAIRAIAIGLKICYKKVWDELVGEKETNCSGVRGFKYIPYLKKHGWNSYDICLSKTHKEFNKRRYVYTRDFIDIKDESILLTSCNHLCAYINGFVRDDGQNDKLGRIRIDEIGLPIDRLESIRKKLLAVHIKIKPDDSGIIWEDYYQK